MDVLALVLSALSLLVAVAGTYLSNKRSAEALELSRRSVIDARWSGLQEAVQRLIGFDPVAEPIGERLANLRIAAIALVDELPEWGGLDEWLAAERTLGVAFGRQVMEEPGESVEERVQKLGPLMEWAQVLSQNLRLLRKGRNDAAVRDLTAHAKKMVIDLHEKNGWDLPPTSSPRIRPLHE